MSKRIHYLAMMLVVMSDLLFAKPYIPTHDNEIIERLPKTVFSTSVNEQFKTLKTRIKNYPDDWDAVSQLAGRYIELAQVNADPRYMGYAQAILSPWWQKPQPPLQALIMRATIRQNSHDFTGAIEDLDNVLNFHPDHTQANLIKATIATVQGDYQDAVEHCRRLLRRSGMALALACQSTPASLSGDAETQYRILHQVLSVAGSMSEKQAIWAWISLAEIAWRLGKFDQAEQHFKTALQMGNPDHYLLRVYADFLLHQQRPSKVIKLLKSKTQIDSLLLRLALAEKMLESDHLNDHIAMLQQRFQANRKRESTLHKGDEARFKLHLLNQPVAALQLARQNWQVQKESADTYILLQSAIAAGDQSTVTKVTHWLQQKGTQDVLIDQMIASLKENRYEI